jgi:hypothetical protein
MKLENLMKRHGQAMSLRLPDEQDYGTFYAFIQPLRYKNKMYLAGVNTQIGYNSEGHYLYIGPPELDLTVAGTDAVLRAGSVDYRIDRAEKVYRGAEVFYIWAIVRTTVASD